MMAYRVEPMLACGEFEIDQLLKFQENPRLKDSIGDIADFLTWRAHGSDVFELRAQVWQAKLEGAGWPVPWPDHPASWPYRRLSPACRVAG